MYWLALGLFVLALLSKTVTASLPALLLVVCWWQRGRLDPRRDVLPLTPFFVLAGAFGALTVWMERTLIGARGAEFGLTLIERGLVAGRAIWFYLGKLFWPADLIFIYPRWRVGEGVWWQYLYPVGVVALFAGLWLWRRRTRAPLAAVLFFTVALFPALGFVNVFPFRYSFVADHFQYLASIGMITLFTGSLATFLRQWELRHRWVPATAAAVVLAPLAFLTWSQSRDYVNAETLYRATIARDPSSWMAHNNLAVLKLSGSVDEAMDHLTEALKSNPDYPEAHNNMGLALQLVGRFEEAEAAHAAALRLQPTFAEAHNNLGTALQKMGRYQEACVAYREAIRLRPDNPPGYANLGNTLLEMGRFEKAISSYRDALRLDPALVNVHFNLATALERLGRREEALAEYGETLRIEAGSADVHSRMGTILEQLGRVEEAVGHYEASAQLEPDSEQAHLKLGNMLYARGDWERAATAYRAAIERKPGSANAHNNLGACQERLGRLEEAVVQYQETVRLLPQSADARANLTRATLQLHERRRGRN
jgi:protein O-mannosyl-transferase